MARGNRHRDLVRAALLDRQHALPEHRGDDCRRAGRSHHRAAPLPDLPPTRGRRHAPRRRRRADALLRAVDPSHRRSRRNALPHLRLPGVSGVLPRLASAGDGHGRHGARPGCARLLLAAIHLRRHRRHLPALALGRTHRLGAVRGRVPHFRLRPGRPRPARRRPGQRGTPGLAQQRRARRERTHQPDRPGQPRPGAARSANTSASRSACARKCSNSKPRCAPPPPR